MHKEQKQVYKISDIKKKARDFDSIEASVMSIMYVLSNNVNLTILFSLLPIHREGPEAPGSIISARIADSDEEGFTRGVVRTGKGFMKNAILVDIVTNFKQLSVKIFKNKIAVCGMKSEEVGLDAAQIMLEIMKKVQYDLDYIKANRDKFNEILDWFRDNTRSEQEAADFRIKSKDDPIIKHTIKFERDRVPTHFDKRILEFFLNQLYDFTLYEEMIDHFANILIVTAIDDVAALSIVSHNINMINYNYDLGFSIKRGETAAEFGNSTDFEVQYKDLAHYAIRIYHVDADGRKNTFSIYKNGLVTQSGPSKENMKIAYNKFMDKIYEIKDRIINSEKVLKVKYKKTN